MRGENETTVRALFESVNARDYAGLDRFFAVEYENANAFPGQTRGPEGARIAVRDLVAAFPDLHFVVDGVISEGDEVAVRLSISGTQKGDYRGVSASGRRFSIAAHEWFVMSGGKAIRGWMQWDMLGLLEQISAGARVAG